MKLPLGFRYASTFAGIRKVVKDDLALIVSDTAASAAAVFTTNQVVAAWLPTDARAKPAFAAAGRASIAGMTKGSGMIHPRMATTLCFVMTDAVISPAALRTALKRATERTFNRISVDGDTSTNDMI